jgi:hypothetical protein
MIFTHLCEGNDPGVKKNFPSGAKLWGDIPQAHPPTDYLIGFELKSLNTAPHILNSNISAVRGVGSVRDRPPGRQALRPKGAFFGSAWVNPGPKNTKFGTPELKKSIHISNV